MKSYFESGNLACPAVPGEGGGGTAHPAHFPLPLRAESL